MLCYIARLPSGAGSFKSQMKKADGSGAAFAVILGEDEMANKIGGGQGHARQATASQQQASVPFDEVVDYLVDQIVGAATTTITTTCITITDTRQ